MDIGSEQAQLAYLGAAGGVAACLAGARVPVVWPRVWPGRGYRRGVATRASSRGEGTGGVAARLAEAAGLQLAPRGRWRAGWRGDRGRA